MARRLLRVLMRPLTRLLARFRSHLDGFDPLPCAYCHGYGEACGGEACRCHLHADA